MISNYSETDTRLRALPSYVKLRDQDIALSDILPIGSRLDIQTDDSED